MAAQSKVNAVGNQQSERLRLAKDSLNAILSDIVNRNAAGDDTRVGVRFFGHRLAWSSPSQVPPPPGWTARLLSNDKYRGRKPESQSPAEDVELVQPLGVFDQAMAG
jgi:hypothetical protein